MNDSPISAVEFNQISKRFGAVAANDKVSFQIPASTVHGVVGENGAGKSTIMKILYGLYQPDDGQILLAGKKTNIHSPRHAIQLGIGMVHQHFMLVPTLAIWQNVILGKEGAWWLDKKGILQELECLQELFGFGLDLNRRIEELAVGHQQQVEILKLLYRKADILILDEPTAVLVPSEVEALFKQLGRLRDSNKTIILITHKLREVFALTENVTVMRHGKVIGTFPTRSLDEQSLSQKMIGRKVVPLEKVQEVKQMTSVLQVQNLCVKQGKRTVLDKLSFNVQAGEILGIAGVEGNGQKELVEVLSNVSPHYE
ncbi:MAG: ATP-binding cassette domain-containing protein, partial [Deltaproteobacteria bacterium]|nr:ATP-binding cassette domain-containing protein [Deltaproteobacteria bacterium]